MQLRVTRLCLDCEELHVDERCPVCASDQYAFLSTWLPSEERRRWHRRGGHRAANADGPGRRFLRAVARWIGLEGEEVPDSYQGPRTRASDHALDVNFDESRDNRTTPPIAARQRTPRTNDR